MATKVVTPKDELIEFNYVQVFEAKSFEGNAPKFSVVLAIPKTAVKTLKLMREAMAEALAIGAAKNGWKGGKLKKAQEKLPLKDGDEELNNDDEPKYPGCYFMTASASTKVPPQVVDAQGKTVATGDENEMYSGCSGRVSVNFYPYDVQTNHGVACGLGNLQVLVKGERKGGGVSTAAADFGIESDFDNPQVPVKGERKGAGVSTAADYPYVDDLEDDDLPY